MGKVTALLGGLKNRILGIRVILTPDFYKRLAEFMKSFVFVWTWQTITFSGLLMCYLLHGMFIRLFSWKIIPKKISQPSLALIGKVYSKIVLFSTKQEHTINRVSLIDLAIKNMLFKRSRALITVGGMAIGIGAIVFLVSLGFGLQEMVISRVARLDELKQADVTTQPGSKEVITDETLAAFHDFGDIAQTLPLIAIVARVEFQNSVTDMAVYGVTSDYLVQSAVQPSTGSLFDSNELSAITPGARVAGVSQVKAEYQEGEYLLTPDTELPVEFSLHEEVFVKIRSNPSRNAPVIGYTKREAGRKQGYRVWGERYPEATTMTLETEDGSYGPWIKADFPLWLEEACQGETPECIDGKYALAKNEQGDQSIQTGYTALVNLTLHTTLAPSDPVGQVLGVTDEEDDDTDSLIIAQAETIDEATAAEVSESSETSTDELTVSDSGWVEIASESALAAQEETVKVALGSAAKRKAVVNRAMLQILGMKEEEAVGKSFKSSFVVVGELLDKPGQKVESIPEEYEIVGVIPEDKVPFFYVPFIDLRLLGIGQYSQLKVISTTADTLHTVRKQIEALGFTTRSVADTVKQIDRLFATARVVLAILGFVALSIAALGMFNTLTVSLLERTREVGLMKAMGMRSNEVRELFLTESLVMGFFGGVLGIVLGSLAGESLGLALSMFSLTKGVGYIDVSYLPATFVTFIFILSLLVGVFTGIYPARRATKISALDALRYE